MENSSTFKIVKVSTNEIKKVGMSKRRAQNWVRDRINPADFQIIDENAIDVQKIAETAKDLMNINADQLMSSNGWHLNVGDVFHARGARIGDWGFTMVVIKRTKTQIHGQIINTWFAVHENTAFGRVAKGEKENDVEWMREVMTPQIERGAWRKFSTETGLEISAGHKCGIVTVFDGDDLPTIGEREATEKAATPSFRAAFIQNIFDTVLRTIVEAAEIKMDERDFTIDVDTDAWTPFGDCIGTITAKVSNRVTSPRVHGSREHDIAPEAAEVEFVLETANAIVLDQRGEMATNITSIINAMLGMRIGKIIR